MRCCICNAHIFLNRTIVPEMFIAHDIMESRVYKWDEWLGKNLAWAGALCHLSARAPGSALYGLCCRLPCSAEVCTPNENFTGALICHPLQNFPFMCEGNCLQTSDTHLLCSASDFENILILYFCLPVLYCVLYSSCFRANWHVLCFLTKIEKLYLSYKWFMICSYL